MFYGCLHFIDIFIPDAKDSFIHLFSEHTVSSHHVKGSVQR